MCTCVHLLVAFVTAVSKITMSSCLFRIDSACNDEFRVNKISVFTCKYRRYQHKNYTGIITLLYECVKYYGIIDMDQLHICICTQTYTHMHTTYTNACTYTYTTYMHALAHIHTHAYHIHQCMYIHIPDLHACACTHTHMYALSLSCIYVNMHPRLGMMWPGVEPERGQYNFTYLEVARKLTKK